MFYTESQLFFYFCAAILLGPVYHFLAGPKPAERVNRNFNRYTVVDHLPALSEHRGCPNVSGTAVIISGRFVHRIRKVFNNPILATFPV